LQIETPAAPTENQVPPKKKNGGFRPGSGRKPKEPKAPTGEPFILPKIPFRRGANRFEDFVKWWHDLNTEQLEKLIIYAYRQWPVCDAKIADPDATDFIDKITGPCPFSIDNWRMDILTRYQSGSYCFYVKEGNVQRWTIYAQDIVDLVNYPPLIDYKTLMLSAPANKDFVRWARQRNLIPNAEEGDNNGMANAAVDRLVDQTDRLTTKILDMADRNSTPPDIDTSTQLAGMEMMQRAGERALDVQSKAFDRIAEMNQRSSDPLELTRTFVELAGALNKPDTGSAQVAALMQQMITAAEKRADRLEEEMRDLRAERHKPEGEAGTGGLLTALKGLGDIKGVLAELGIIKTPSEDEEGLHGKQNGDGNKPSSLKEALLQQAIQQLPQMLPQILGAGGINGLLVNGFRLIQAARGQGPVPGSTVDTAPPAVAQATPAPTIPPAVISNGFPFPQMTGQPMIDNLIVTVWRFTPTLLHHMSNNDLNGYTFARWLIDSDPAGRQRYDEMKEAKREDVEAMLKMYPPLWDQLSKTPQKTEGFLTELLRLDEWEKEQAALEDQDDEGDETAV
jgi:hypothetical protein